MFLSRELKETRSGTTSEPVERSSNQKTQTESTVSGFDGLDMTLTL